VVATPFFTIREVLADHTDSKTPDHLHCRIAEVGFETDPDMYLADPLQIVQVLIIIYAAEKVDEPVAMALLEPMQ